VLAHEGARRRRGSVAGALAAIGLVALMMHPIAAAAPVPGAITLRVVDANGSALAGATVRVYLMPFNAGDRFIPPLLAGGTADASGAFSGAMNLQPVEDMLLRTRAGGTRFNAIVVAVDPAHRWRAEAFHVLSTTVPASLRVQAGQDLSRQPTFARWSTQDLVAEGPVLSAGACPVGQCLPDVIRYPVVFTNNSAGGTRSDMTFTHSAATSHQTTTSVTYSSFGNEWRLAGTAEEMDSRTGVQGPIAHKGGYHYYWTAEYTFREYCNAPRGGCVAFWWSPLKWDGQIYQGEPSHTPPPNRYARVFVGPYSRTHVQTKTYTNSFYCCVSGAQISNTSMAQYGDITSMTWRRNRSTTCGGGRTIWIYGDNDFWNNSNEVYLNCTF
jgi:hypothetical protein